VVQDTIIIILANDLSTVNTWFSRCFHERSALQFGECVCVCVCVCVVNSGAIFGVRSFAPILGFLLGAWTNSVYVDLTGTILFVPVSWWHSIRLNGLDFQPCTPGALN